MALFLLFIKSFVAGIIIFAPLGPASAICVRRTLQRGFWAGFVSGLGAVTADMICATIAGFGIISILNLINHHRAVLAGTSALFLFVIGLHMLLSPKISSAPEQELPRYKWHNDYLSILIFTITNPTTLLQFFLVFPWLGLNKGNIYLNLGVVLVGLLISTLIWWTILCLTVSYGRTKLSPRAIGLLDRSLGFIILTVAVILLFSTRLNVETFDWLYRFLS